MILIPRAVTAILYSWSYGLRLKLVDIPGVGSRIRDKLVEQYGSEEKALNIILDEDITALCEILSVKQALSLAKWAQGFKHNTIPGDFLATEEVDRLYQMIISKIEAYSHTEYARFKIATLFPSSSRELIDRNRKLVKTSVTNAQKLEGSGIDELIISMKPLREGSRSRIRERAIVVRDPEIFGQLKARGLDKLIDIHIVESPEEVTDLARGYSHICLVGDLESPSRVEQAASLDDWYLAPEMILQYYKDNLVTILSAIEAATILVNNRINCFDGLVDMQNLMNRLKINNDEKSNKWARQLTSLNECIEDSASWANSELRKRIEASTVTLGGTDLLQALHRNEGIKELFEIQLCGMFQGVLKEAKSRAASYLELTGPDIIWLDEILSSEIHFPLELNRSALMGFEQELRGRLETRRLMANREMAKILANKKEFIKEIVNLIQEFDFAYALGKFSLSEGLVLPEIVDHPCIGFKDGLNLFIEGAEPVNYSLGNTGLNEFHERVVILSGVNSGGKTSLLDLIAQITILGHMGLPVPAKQCYFGIFQEVYYFSKSRGTLSTGAFETAMRKFAKMENDERKLVLADELEAITEPGASARIIACMLDELNRLGSVAVFVSHLAEDVKRFTETQVRVDGIETEGLDDENNLIVQRSPRYDFLARSTPELILDKLARTTLGKEKEFYSRLLARFR
jgi:DNA mismatch repair protein MutS2